MRLTTAPRAAAAARAGPPIRRAAPRCALAPRPHRMPTHVVVVAATATGGLLGPQPPPSEAGVAAAASTAAVAGLVTAWKAGAAGALVSALEASALAAAVPAFSLVFLSEIGDKTFFLAALLAARVGRRAAFAGSLGALALMSVISAAIGAACRRVPDAVASSLPLSTWASTACLVWFGVSTLRAALALPPAPKAAAAASARSSSSAVDDSDSELSEAEDALAEAEKAGRVTATAAAGMGEWRRLWVATLEVGSLIFLAEWGDRSMLATIALAAAQGPVGVAVGATAGHAVATAGAVLGGALVAKSLSERAIGIVGGVLFLVFAAATLAGWM